MANLKDKFKGFLARKLFTHASVLEHFGLCIGDYKGARTKEELIAKIQGWSWTCIDRNAKACAQVPLRLYTTTRASNRRSFKTNPIPKRKHGYLHTKLAERVNLNDTLEEVVDHPILDLLRRVNPNDNAFDIKELLVKYLEAIAVCYWWLERGVGDEIINIWPLMSQHVEPVLNKNKTQIAAYKYKIGQIEREYRPEDIVHFKYTSMTNPLVGDSPTKAGEETIDITRAMNQFEIASFKNGGNPSMVMEVPVDSALPPDEKKRIEADYRSTIGGVKNTGKLFIASGGAKVQQFGHSPKEMNFLNGRKTTLEEICGVYGVPLAFVKPTEMSRANLWASLDLWMNYTINPKLVMIEQKLNEQFTPNWGEDLFLLFDDARPEDPEKRLKEIEVHLKTKYSSINEERGIDGLEPVEWGDEPVEEEPIEAEPVQEPQKTKQEGPTNDLPEPDFMPNVFLTSMVMTFKKMETDITKNLRNYGKTKQDEDDAFAGSINDIVSSVFSQERWGDEIANEALPFIRGLLTNGLIDAMEKIKPDALVNASSPEVMRALDERTAQIKSVATTIQKEVRDQISESISKGESRSQTIQRIREHFDARDKADRVVRSETIWAHNEGTELAWEQSNVVQAKRWNTVADDRRCPFCKKMHNETIPLRSKFFDKGQSLEAVSDAGNPITLGFDYEPIKHPPLHPNCRCQLIPILSET